MDIYSQEYLTKKGCQCGNSRLEVFYKNGVFKSLMNLLETTFAGISI